MITTIAQLWNEAHRGGALLTVSKQPVFEGNGTKTVWATSGDVTVSAAAVRNAIGCDMLTLRAADLVGEPDVYEINRAYKPPSARRRRGVEHLTA